jgi:hypothetical protein
MTPLELFSIIDRLPDGYEFPMAAATSKGDAKAIFRRFPNYNRIDVGGVPGHDPLTYLIQDWQGNPHPPMRSVMLDGGSNYSWGNIEDVLRSVDPSAARDKHPAKAPGPPARAPKARPRAGLRLVENDLDQLEQEVAALDQPYQAPAPPPPPRSAPAPRAQVSATGQWKPKQEIGAVLLASQSSPVGFSGGDVGMISKPPPTARGERDPAVSLSNYRPRDVSGDRESWWFRYYTQDHRPGDKPVWGRVDANVDDWGVRVRNTLTANYSGDFFPMYVQLFRPERGNQPTPEGVEIGSEGRWEWHRSDPPPVTVGLPVTVSVGNSTRGGRIVGMNKKRSRIVIEVPGSDDLSGKYSWRAKSEGYWKVGNQTKWYNGVELGMARDHTALD